MSPYRSVRFLSSSRSMRGYYYGERRKSTGPCLQGPSSEKDISIPALIISPPPTRQCPKVLGINALRRINSARENRKGHEASRVFPAVQGREPDRLKSRYSVEYCAKKLSSPTRARPLSPTRMNNPHPAKVRNAVAAALLLYWCKLGFNLQCGR